MDAKVEGGSIPNITAISIDTINISYIRAKKY